MGITGFITWLIEVIATLTQSPRQPKCNDRTHFLYFYSNENCADIVHGKVLAVLTSNPRPSAKPRSLNLKRYTPNRKSKPPNPKPKTCSTCHGNILLQEVKDYAVFPSEFGSLRTFQNSRVGGLGAIS